MEEMLQSRIVLVDTCVFRNSNFRLDNNAFSEFKRLCRDEEFELVTTKITQQEIKCRIHEFAVEAFAALQKFRDKTHLLPRMHARFGKVYEHLSVAMIEDGLEKTVNGYFKQAKAKVLPIPKNAAEIVFQKYFKQEKPFQEGKKKSEFPDAFVIQALSSLKKKVYVVSADGDFEGASKNVLQVKNLSELLHLYNSHTDVVAGFVQKLVLKNRAKLLPWIQAGLEKIPARLKDSDGQIRFGEMHLLDITDAWVVSFKKGSAEVSVEFKFQISCQAMELDESGYIADLPSFEEEHASQAQIQVRFNPKNESVFHFHGLRFSEDLESGIEIG